VPAYVVLLRSMRSWPATAQIRSSSGDPAGESLMERPLS